MLEGKGRETPTSSQHRVPHALVLPFVFQAEFDFLYHDTKVDFTEDLLLFCPSEMEVQDLVERQELLSGAALS